MKQLVTKQLVIRTHSQLVGWLGNPVPARIIGIDNFKLPHIEVTMNGEDNQNSGLILEECRNVTIINPTVTCTTSEPPPYRRGYGIVINNSENVLIRGGGFFQNLHSAIMVTDGSRDVQIGDTDNDIVTRDCWMTDVHGGGCHNVRFYRIVGDARIHVGNITQSLAEFGQSSCVVHRCCAPAIEVAGRSEDIKVYHNVAEEYRLYPFDGLPFDVRLEDAGFAAVVVKMMGLEKIA
jgi:hypothetical protein